jgi:hypothetical protein
MTSAAIAAVTALAVSALAVTAALVAWLRRRFVVINVDGPSMQPTPYEATASLCSAGRGVLGVVVRQMRRHHQAAG